MRQELAKDLRSKFEAQFLRTYSSFAKDKLSAVPPGWRCYSCQVGSDLSVFVMLVVLPHSDAFTIEVIWSHDATLPEFIPLCGPEDEIGGGVQAIRIYRFWSNGETEEQVWNLDNPLSKSSAFGLPVDAAPTHQEMENVPVLVAETLDKIRVLVMPYFQRVSAYFGYEFSAF